VTDAAAVQPRDIVVLAGRSLKGKNRIREYGERWLVRAVDRSILAPNLGLLICPATYIGSNHLTPEHDRPSEVVQRDGYARWLRKHNDPDFEIVNVEARGTLEA
jgi:hypothetical protein